VGEKKNTTAPSRWFDSNAHSIVGVRSNDTIRTVRNPLGHFDPTIHVAKSSANPIPSAVVPIIPYCLLMREQYNNKWLCFN
jgi:hypothetical protein